MNYGNIEVNKIKGCNEMYRYYSKVRPIMIGGFPKSDAILEIVNFDEKKYDPYLGDYAYGYISAEEVLEGYEDYELTEVKSLYRRKLQEGDVIVIDRSSSVIVTIYHQLCNGLEISCDFLDENGQRVVWNSYETDGAVIYYDDKDLSKELNEVEEEELNILLEGYRDIKTELGISDEDLTELCRSNNSTYILRSGSVNVDAISLDFSKDSDLKALLKAVTDRFGFVDRILLPSAYTKGHLMIYKESYYDTLRIVSDTKEVEEIVGSLKVESYDSMVLSKLLNDLVGSINLASTKMSEAFDLLDSAYKEELSKVMSDIAEKKRNFESAIESVYDKSAKQEYVKECRAIAEAWVNCHGNLRVFEGYLRSINYKQYEDTERGWVIKNPEIGKLFVEDRARGLHIEINYKVFEGGTL